MYRNRDISPDSTMLDALKRMDQLDKKLLIVIQDDKFVGLLSAGDVQRAIIANKGLDTKVDSILRKDIKLGKETDSIDSIKSMMIQFRMEFYPIIDDNNQIVEIHFWEDLFSNEKTSKGQFNSPVVIMAGGYGTRLKPLTNVIPKAMVPIGDKTMLEEIFDRFGANGCDTFFLSVNYKAELIEYYLKNQNLPYNIDYFKEVKPLGTAGSLTMLKGKIKETFFVNNCDIIINEDYSEILNYHKKMKNKITIVAALKTYNIPYGTVESGEDGILQEIKEKPELNFMINSGMYILEPELLDRIPENTFYHITDLINELKENGEQIGVFPVREKSWIDMGDWAEYMAAIKS
jgi:dTDP-glucose pyrophosphorylase